MGELNHWAVSVCVNGTEILCIESNCLSGVENVADYAEDIRRCAGHLLAFIGSTESPEAAGLTTHNPE